MPGQFQCMLSAWQFDANPITLVPHLGRNKTVNITGAQDVHKVCLFYKKKHIKKQKKTNCVDCNPLDECQAFGALPIYDIICNFLKQTFQHPVKLGSAITCIIIARGEFQLDCDWSFFMQGLSGNLFT